ncbi:hypothetical protein Acr_06g0017020 [Actinidia rufa]|uniref:Uncharacterized protein n=1 Tax=Actinidia rufa TaxID=165716 RepID=A0A7J0ETT2_9ERIC|nr:hypothetical protein Acr_06g0017020 [Actinidia rufa]
MLCAPSNPPRIPFLLRLSSLSLATLSIYRPQSREDELMDKLIHASILDHGEPPSATSSQPSATSLSVSSFLPFHSHPEKEKGSINVAPSRVWPDFRTYPKASPCAHVPLWILQVHPSGIPALALRDSVQRLLSSSILLASTTRPMSDNSSSCLDTPLQSV